jgi:hypothetical protein
VAREAAKRARESAALRPTRSHLRIVIPHPDETMADNRKTLADLLAALREARATHALVGGLVAGHYGKRRATVDVDMLIPERAAEKVQAALVRRKYVIQMGEGMMRAYRPRSKEAAADLVWREANPVLEAAAAETVPATILGLPVRIVKRGAFVALKYHAAISPMRRPADKHQDVSDIMEVLDKKFGPADEKLAVRIAEHAYPGGGQNLADMLDDIRHHRTVKV